MKSRVTAAVAALAALGFAALAALVALRAGEGATAVAQTQLVGIAYLLAGTVAWWRRPDNATGPLLVAIACCWYIPEFQAAAEPAVAGLAYATRRLVNALSVYLLLVFPSGHLSLRRHRLAIGVVFGIAAIQVPTRLLMTERIPAQLDHADRVTIFGCDCANPFGVLPAPALLDGIERWTAFLSVAVSLVILGLVIERLVRATPATRRILWPVLFGAVVGLLVFAYSLLSSMLALRMPYEIALGAVLSVARAAVPIGFLIGLLRMKLGHAAVAGLVVGIQGGRTADSLERSIAAALHDPTARIGTWSPATRAYLDSTGRALALPQQGSGKSASFVERHDLPLGVIVHDSALDDDKALLDAVSAAFALSVDRDRLASTVHAQAEDARRLPSGPVTFLYADVEGSTLLLDQLGERYAELLAEERRLIRAIVRAHGGVEIDSRADEFFAAFSKLADPGGAALAIQRGLRDHAWPAGATVRVRIGLHHGVPQMTDEGYVGLDVHRAARIGSAAHGGQVVLSDATRAILAARLPPQATMRCLGVVQLKGVPGHDTLWQLEVPDLPQVFAALRVEAHLRDNAD